MRTANRAGHGETPTRTSNQRASRGGSTRVVQLDVAQHLLGRNIVQTHAVHLTSNDCMMELWAIWRTTQRCHLGKAHQWCVAVWKKYIFNDTKSQMLRMPCMSNNYEEHPFGVSNRPHIRRALGTPNGWSWYSAIR